MSPHRDRELLFRRAPGGYAVFHRATGLRLGEVSMIPWGVGRPDAGVWVVWSAADPDGAGSAEQDESVTTRYGAGLLLLEAARHQPPIVLRQCDKHRTTMSITPFACSLGDRCDTPEEGRARSRREQPVGWMLTDAVARLPAPSAFWRCHCCGEHQTIEAGTLPGRPESPCACMRRECRRGAGQHGGSWMQLATWDAEPTPDQRRRMGADCHTKAQLGHLGSQ